MAIGDGKTYVFYHSADLDGLCSGAIAKHFIPHAIMMPINYGDAFPWHILTHNDEVLMLDFSLSPAEMLRLANTVALFHWIDHHDTAIKSIEPVFRDAGMMLLGLRNNEEDPAKKRAACELAWEYMAPSKSPVPAAVTLLGAYDTWRYVGTEDEQDVWAFQLRMRLEELNPVMWEDCKDMWCSLFAPPHPEQPWDDSPWSLIAEGYILARFDQRQKMKYAKSYAFKADFVTPCTDPTCLCIAKCQPTEKCTANLYKVLAINLGHTNSKIFDSVPNRDQYAFFVSFVRRSSARWNVSLYGNPEHSDVHVGEVAKLFGGGGHKNAAGFNCTTEELPFNI